MTRPTVSIIIPAYNEESQIAACLDAVARQTVKPLEVIVVDNNSADNTVAIARQYPFVTVLHEKRQGPVYARDCGFDAARGTIIGRIDADSQIADDWVATLQNIFADPNVRAVSGRPLYRDVGLADAINAIDLRVRNYMTRRMGALGEQFLYGSNMGIRRDAWLVVRDKVCHKRFIHEDIDLAAHMVGMNSGVIFSADLQASVDWRQASAGPKQFIHHVWSSDPVFTEHVLRSRKYERRVALLVSLMYPVIHLLYRGYNPATKRFSLTCLLSGIASVRTSPVSDSL